MPLLSYSGSPPKVAIDPNEVAVLPYSSGTTGLAKGVMLTHRNLVANMVQLDGAGHLRDGEDTLVCFLPFFHIYGLVVVMLLGLWRGATLVVMPRFELEHYLTLIERHKATMLHVVPPVLLTLAKHPALEGRDFSSVRKLFSGAAPLSTDVIAACTARLGCYLQQGYGLTEASPATHTTIDDPSAGPDGSVGVPLRTPNPASWMSRREGSLDPVRAREKSGFEARRSCSATSTAPMPQRETIAEDGWLRTGDIARVDEHHRFHIVDRLKELIKYKGMQIAPAELEGVLISHPAVADAAVIPVPDDEAGEVPKAFVVLKADTGIEELLAFVASRVAAFKKIRRMELVDQIPKSPSGKILRRVLRERERARASAGPTTG